MLFTYEWGHFSDCKIKYDQIKYDQVKYDQIKYDQIKYDQIKKWTSCGHNFHFRSTEAMVYNIYYRLRWILHESTF